MNQRAKIITEQALARKEQEAIYRALAESLGKPDITADDPWYDEAQDRLATYDCGESLPSKVSFVTRQMSPALDKEQKHECLGSFSVRNRIGRRYSSWGL